MNRGDVYWVELPGPWGRRPAVILTRQEGLSFLTSVTVGPITSTLRHAPTWVRLGIEDGLPHESSVNLDSIQTIRADRLGERVTRLSPERMRQVSRAARFALALDES
ncbi:MAG: type II toxin-antitoxin system PemK/MazF family toxin [Thermoflexaceae bacterium]|nr:type II toxin-antitoxin system PemK/MazF family toxin [Thermoflexaceae bacterium]